MSGAFPILRQSERLSRPMAWLRPACASRNAGVALRSCALALLSLPALLLAPLLAPLPGHGQVAVLFSSGTEIEKAAARGVAKALKGGVQEFTFGKAENAPFVYGKVKEGGFKLAITLGSPATRLAAAGLAGLPIVYCLVLEPPAEAAKRPGMTGVTLQIPMEVQFRHFRRVVPEMKRLGVVYDAKGSQALAAEMRKAAAAHKLALVDKGIGAESELPEAIRGLKGRIDGLYLPPDRTVTNFDAFEFVTLFTFENNIPFMAPTSRFVKKGALISLLIDYEEVGRQAGEMAARVLAGQAPSALPPEPPRSTMLILNQKTAETIGINIPPELQGSSSLIR